MKKLQLSILFMLIFLVSTFAQEIQNPPDVPNVIISEVRMDEGNRYYYEITNLEDSVVDLSSFTLFWSYLIAKYSVDPVTGYLTWDRPPIEESFHYEGKLGPKESHVISVAWDRPLSQTYPHTTMSFHQEKMVPLVDTFLFRYESYPSGYKFLDAPEKMAFGRDSATNVDNNGSGYLENYTFAGNTDMGWRIRVGLHLAYVPDTSDVQIVIDGFLSNLDPNTNQIDWGGPSVAGVWYPMADYIFVRKSWVNRPNADWSETEGADTEDSEWLLLPSFNGFSTVGENTPGNVGIAGDRIPFTTVGVHGNYDIDVNSTAVDIDLTANTVTVPWGTRKGDGLISHIDFGPNMGWYYHEDPTSVADSASLICMDGDTLEIFAAGDVLTTKKLAVKVEAPQTDMAEVFELRKRVYPTEEDPDIPTHYDNFTTYLITEGESIDSITWIPFATRTDTLLKYLEKAPNATWEFVWVDGVERVDLKDGDKLKVTAEDGSTTKEYYLSVKPAVKSNNSLLASISWPDYPEAELLDWVTGDTIPDFSPNRYTYTIKLPYGTTAVPALLATTEDANATVEQDRATNLKGDNAMRTTTFTVKAESDTVHSVYTVTFEMDRPPELIQKYIGEPFISDIMAKWRSRFSAIEIMNPSDTAIDLSQYLFVGARFTTNPAEGMVELYDKIAAAWMRYVPGRILTAPTKDEQAEYEANGPWLENDPAVNPILQPKKTFVLQMVNINRGVNPGDDHYNPHLRENVPGVTFTTGANPWGITMPVDMRFVCAFGAQAKTVWMYKIANDSVRNGTKQLGIDMEDYELIDVFGWNDLDAPRMIAGIEYHGITPYDWLLTRKPDYYKPNPALEGGFGTNAEDSEWIVRQTDLTENGDRNQIPYSIGPQNLNPITEHISMVTSVFLLVSDGFEGTQTIEGVTTGATVSQMMDLLMPADPLQVLEVKASDGTAKTGDDVIAAGDQLHVTSPNGENTTVYDLIISELDSDAVLVAKDLSNLTVTVTGETGTVEGMAHDAPLAAVLDQLIVPDLAVLHVIDADGNLIPMSLRDANGDLVPVTASAGVFLEVTAQNGDIILYSMQYDSPDGVYVTSDLYAVDQDLSVIANIPAEVNVATILRNVYGSSNSEVHIIDKAGITRNEGLLYFDDKLEVVSEDGSMSKVYYLTFIGEENADQNYAPSLEIESASLTAVANEAFSVSVTATDDGLPYPSELTYNWSVTDGVAENVTIDAADQSTTDVVISEPGDYEITIMVDDGELQSSEAISISADWRTDVVLNEEPGITLYPNPANNSFFLDVRGLNNISGTVKVVDITGKVVMINEINSENMRVDVSDLTSGLYYIKVRSGDQTFSSKLQIVR